MADTLNGYDISEARVPMVVVGIDLYNQTTTGGVAKSLNSIATDSDHVPCVLVLNDQGGGNEREL